MILKIYRYTDSANGLHNKCRDILTDEFSNFKGTIANMIETCKFYQGLGLSANQIGYQIKLCICKISNMNYDFIPMFNPEIIDSSEKIIESEEGCLSLRPGKIYTVKRHEYVIVRYFMLDTTIATERFEGIDAYVVQHEIDHLNGISVKDIEEKLI